MTLCWGVRPTAPMFWAFRVKQPCFSLNLQTVQPGVVGPGICIMDKGQYRAARTSFFSFLFTAISFLGSRRRCWSLSQLHMDYAGSTRGWFTSSSGPSVSIRGFGTLLHVTSVVLWRCPCTFPLLPEHLPCFAMGLTSDRNYSATSFGFLKDTINPQKCQLMLSLPRIHCQSYKHRRLFSPTAIHQRTGSWVCS